MRIRGLLLLVLILLTACESHLKEEKILTARPVRFIGAIQPKKNSAEQQDRPAVPPPAPAASSEEYQGSVEPHLMKFQRISEEDMWLKIERGEIEPNILLGRFLLSTGSDRRTLLYYRLPVYPNGWLETQFEPVGEWLSSQGVELDTVRLEPDGPPAVIAKFHCAGSLRHWTTNNEGINIIDVSKEPVLVLTAGTASHEYAYTGDEEADTTDTTVANNTVEIIQSQSIEVHKQLIVVEPANEDGQYALFPAPPGTYRYQNGRMFRVGK